MIYRRKSVRSYTGVPVESDIIEKIKGFISSLVPLMPEKRVRSEIVSSENVKCILPWKTPQSVAIFAEAGNDALVNAGFLYQQLDLYLQSIGLGSCWLGMGKLAPKDNDALKSSDGLEFVMMIAFGYPKGNARRNGAAEFKRKSLKDISDIEDDRLEPARLAPSSINSQPWYFTHKNDKVRAYCALSGVFKKKTPSDMNLIDMGIALAHMYVANMDTFRFTKEENVPAIKGRCYIGSFVIE